jgi:hypothetical protein
VPTATPKPKATATPTTNPNSALDTEAAASFRAIDMGTFSDESCSPANARTHFVPGQTIYANLCTSGAVAAGPMTAVIRQNGTTVWTMTPPTPTYLAPNGGYSYSTYTYLAPGNYDLFITFDIGGHAAMAADPQFRVG